MDGFRVDAVKHMGELASSRFCSNIREYAYSLGKRGFFLFGEVATPDDEVYNRYIGQNTSGFDGDNTVFFGLDSVLDFRLAEGVFGDENNAPLRDVSRRASRGRRRCSTAWRRSGSRALNRGEIGRYLVTFVDNHDSFWQPGRALRATAPPTIRSSAPSASCCASSERPASTTAPSRASAARAATTQMREAMFDTAPRWKEPAEHGMPDLSGDRQDRRRDAHGTAARGSAACTTGRSRATANTSGYPFGSTYTLAFSRMLYPRRCWSPTTCPNKPATGQHRRRRDAASRSVVDDFPPRRLGVSAGTNGAGRNALRQSRSRSSPVRRAQVGSSA